GAPRFTLTYIVEKSYESYAQLIVRADNTEQLQRILLDFEDYLKVAQPDVEYKMKPLEMGPTQAAKIEARFSGSNPVVLRQLADQARAVLAADPGVHNLRDNWRQRTKVLQPEFNEAAARRLGITKSDVDDVL